jgi:hypothetical protein
MAQVYTLGCGEVADMVLLKQAAITSTTECYNSRTAVAYRRSNTRTNARDVTMSSSSIPIIFFIVDIAVYFRGIQKDYYRGITKCTLGA